jgi:hypothetical protein
LADLGAWFAQFVEGFRSDRCGEFIESCCETQVLNKGVAADHV